MKGIRFRKRIPVFPLVWLNFGKNGFNSVTVGFRGLSLNMGRSGVFFNLSVVGTGISYRKQLFTTSKPKAKETN